MRPDPAVAPRRPAYRALAVTVVTLALACLFLVALLREFGWSSLVLAGAFSIFTLVSGGAGPALGALADRFGPRRLILIGGVLLAASLWADSFVTRAWHLYLAFGVLTAIGVATAGWTPAVVLVQRQRGARLGLGAWLAGRIFDATGSYALAFSIAAGAAAVAALSVWGSRMPRPESG
jgi:hypothetical protein